MTRLVALLLALLVLTGCSGGSEPGSAPTPSSSPSASESTAVPPPPPPGERACYLLRYDAAVADHNHADPVSCRREHTAATYYVGDVRIPTEQRAAQQCPARLDGYLGGDAEARALTMLRPVWFTPTPEEVEAGARWFRCDVVALAADGRLAPLTGPVEGALDRPETRDQYAMCGTAEPGSRDFRRVICARTHTWRAISVVPFSARTYPGEAAVREAGQDPCQAAGAAVADDSLDYRWGYEWPTRDQWDAGQRYGRCWAPNA
ncbi:septum formation family protein [Nocardioides caricicola]|uniref:Septum formation family protein n=1 Tax=Nocardioides caricicola TaxID=634770 RepID=A0ABW0N8L9_9ACTN